MADAAELTNQGDVVRQIKDRATSVTVKMGGTFVLALLLLIFVYLFAVTMPLLKSASVEQKLAYSLSLPGETVHVGVENNQKYVYRYSAQGQLAVFDPFSPSTTRQEITLTDTPSSFYSLPGKHHITAYGQTDGRVVFHQLSSSMNSPSFRPDISAFFPDTSLEEGLPVSALTFGLEQNVLTVAGQVGSHIVIVRMISVARF
ncbi:hypothetical protein [Veronia nyctiphanis]|uniref:hypothetical protein n=1 Tax=Veronia nyctiphanis TaxID=1278244 RepID=UPI001F2E3EFE|nr:hypothetical protein [Veronia nyctiphanis]